ncbi:Lrp/AsnC family transcriptional regulator [Ornithinimicrobium sp. Y1847]|uniref:Lrp/AsnC family transcriptional regulator n=1 Tax=unclassified Ornithinimicrobium TaxID=2615080 RepID=UPI003B68213F
MVEAEVRQHQLTTTVTALRGIPEVLECLAHAGGTDLLIRVAASDTHHLFTVLERVRACPGIVRTRTGVMLRELIPYRVGQLLPTELATRPLGATAVPDSPG